MVGNYQIIGTGQSVIELEYARRINENQGSHLAMFILWLRKKLVLSSGAAVMRTHNAVQYMTGLGTRGH